MLTPEQIAALRDRAAELAVPMEEYLIRDIARRVKGAGQLTSTAAYQIWQAQQLGMSRTRIEKMLRQQLQVSHKELRELLTQSAEVGYSYDIKHLPREAVPFESNPGLQQTVAAAVKLAQRDFTNLTNTLGMVAPDGKAYPIRKAYQKIMDYAFEQVFTGAADYNTAIRQATKNLADYGIRSIDYESGVSTSLEAAVRRNVMGSLGLMQEEISRQNHDALEADGWELSAHSGSAPDHEPYQGRQYTDEEFQRLNSRLARRIGTLNCGHTAHPIILGVSRRQYSDEDLERMREENAKGIDYQGRHYTQYEASQKQRQIEAAIRREKNRVLVAETTGDKDGLLKSQIRLGRLRGEYRSFSAAAGLRTQGERAWVSGFGRKAAGRALKASKKNDIIKPKVGGAKVEQVSQTGLFAGALDPDSQEANAHSVRYYASVREMKNDTAAIARNTGWTEKAIDKIKRHVFLDAHNLGGPEPERFDPDYNMAVSWQRLMEGRDIRKQDIILLKHEYLELTLMRVKGLSYREAHNLANEKHNYAEAIREVEE